MIIYNTTYTVANADAKNFIIWVHEFYLPKAQESGILTNGRLLHILTHKDPDSECFSVQFETESKANLQKWYHQNGQTIIEEVLKVFGENVVGFSTILDDITLREG